MGTLSLSVIKKTDKYVFYCIYVLALERAQFSVKTTQICFSFTLSYLCSGKLVHAPDYYFGKMDTVLSFTLRLGPSSPHSVQIP